MPENTQVELSKNFVPSIPHSEISSNSSKPEQKVFLDRVKDNLGSVDEKKRLTVEEVQDLTQDLYQLLLHRVELKIDIHRQKNIGEESENATPVANLDGEKRKLSLEKRMELIKKGDINTALSEVLSPDPENVRQRTLESDLKDLKETEQRVSELIKHPQVAEQYNKFREERVKKLRNAKEVSDGINAVRKLNLQQEKMSRGVFLQGRQYSPGERRILSENKQLIQAVEARVDELKKDSEVFDLVRLRQLQEYQKGFKNDRFAETPSREKYINKIRQDWAQGKKILLTGPTGGGKTELLLHASRSLFNEEAERLTGHELLTNYEVYGKTKGGVKEGQITLMFGSAPFVRALERNVPFIFDELNAVPNKILLRLKTDLNAKIGQRITIQEDGDKEVKVGDKFAVGATENVKSEKHTDREKLDAAIVRMFEPMIIDYFPSEELYDVMLASLMDARGGAKLSVKDASETLKALCDSTEWVQRAYLGQTISTAENQILAARGEGSIGKPATLREAVLDPGKALGMLVGWEDAQKEGLTFREFLNQRILAFINNENYPEEDRYYLTEIFALQGFLRGVNVSEIRVSGLDQATLDTWSGFDGKRYIPKNNYIPSETVAKLDPYGLLKRPVIVEARDLLDEDEEVEEVVEEEELPKAEQTGKQIPKPSPATPSGPLSFESRRALETFTIQNPIQEAFDNRWTREAYLNGIIKFAENYPDAQVEATKMLVPYVDRLEDSFQIYSFVLSFVKFVQLVGKKPGITPIFRDILTKVDNMSGWKVKGNENLEGTQNLLLEIEKLLA